MLLLNAGKGAEFKGKNLEQIDIGEDIIEEDCDHRKREEEIEGKVFLILTKALTKIIEVLFNNFLLLLFHPEISNTAVMEEKNEEHDESSDCSEIVPANYRKQSRTKKEPTKKTKEVVEKSLEEITQEKTKKKTENEGIKKDKLQLPP